MPYPAPNATNLVELFSYANTVTGGVFWNLILMGIFVVVYIALSSVKQSRTSNNFAGASFLTAVVALFMFVLGFILVLPLLISIVLAIASFILLVFSKD